MVEDDRAPVKHGGMRSLVSPTLHYIDHARFGSQLYKWVTDDREVFDFATQTEMRRVIDRFQSQLKRDATTIQTLAR